MKGRTVIKESTIELLTAIELTCAKYNYSFLFKEGYIGVYDSRSLKMKQDYVAFNNKELFKMYNKLKKEELNTVE